MATLSVRSRWMITVAAFCIIFSTHCLTVVRSPWFAKPPKPVGDGLDYENIAFHLSTGRGFHLDTGSAEWRKLYSDPAYDQLLQHPRSLAATGRPPLYPLLVAGIYKMTGRGTFAFQCTRVFAAFCTSLACALAALTTALLVQESWQRASPATSKSPDTSNKLRWTITVLSVALTITLASSNRTLQDYATDFLTEPLATLLMQSFILSTLLAFGLGSANHRSAADSGNTKDPTRKYSEESMGHQQTRPTTEGIYLLLGGICYGLLVLTRSIHVVWLPALAILLWASTKPKSRSSILIFVCCVLAICLPWWIHNVTVLKRWMPLGTQGPITLLGGYSDEAADHAGEWQPEPERRLRASLAATEEYSALGSGTEREVLVAESAARQVRSWVAANSDKIPSMVVGRIKTHWNPYSGRSLIWKLLILAGALSAVLFLPHRYSLWLVGLPIASTLVAATLYTVGGRFLVPLYPLLFTLAGLSFCGLLAALGPFQRHN